MNAHDDGAGAPLGPPNGQDDEPEHIRFIAELEQAQNDEHRREHVERLQAEAQYWADLLEWEQRSIEWWRELGDEFVAGTCFYPGPPIRPRAPTWSPTRRAAVARELSQLLQEEGETIAVGEAKEVAGEVVDNIDKLRDWARHESRSTEAAVEILIRNGAGEWVRNDAPWVVLGSDVSGDQWDFRRWIDPDRLGPAEVNDQRWSSRSRPLLMVARSLLLGGEPVDLAEIAPQLDAETLAMIVAALTYAAWQPVTWPGRPR